MGSVQPRGRWVTRLVGKDVQPLQSVKLVYQSCSWSWAARTLTWVWILCTILVGIHVISYEVVWFPISRRVVPYIKYFSVGWITTSCNSFPRSPSFLFTLYSRRYDCLFIIWKGRKLILKYLRWDDMFNFFIFPIKWFITLKALTFVLEGVIPKG
jgi:hypothetical protein